MGGHKERVFDPVIADQADLAGRQIHVGCIDDQHLLGRHFPDQEQAVLRR